MKRIALKNDERAAATELGYIFTFLLGVLLLTMFSLWAYEIETATRERWNENAIQSNLDDLAAAVERADEASRMGSVDYAEKVTWRLTEADEGRMTLILTDTSIELIHDGGTLDTNVSISAQVLEVTKVQLFWQESPRYGLFTLMELHLWNTTDLNQIIDSSTHNCSMDLGLNFPHSRLRTEFSKHRQGSLQIFHSTRFIWCHTTKTREEFSDLHP